MTKFEQGGGGFQNNTNGPFEGIEMSHPRRTAEEAAEQAQRVEKRAASKAERTAVIEKWKNRGKKVLAALILAGATTMLIFSGKEKHPGEPLEREAWEEAMREETSGYGANIRYNEEGSTISFNSQFDGMQTQYTFFDLNNDTLFEKAHASNQKGGADIEFTDSEFDYSESNGRTFQGALQGINEKMNTAS